MQLQIQHDTNYLYDSPVAHGLQHLRLTPRSTPTQQVLEWSTEVEGGRKQVEYTDHFGNLTELVAIEPGVTSLLVRATGTVVTTDTLGVADAAPGPVPLWLYQRSTELTAAGSGIASLIEGLEGPTLARLHDLMARVGEKVQYQPGHSTSADPAELALASGFGVCQDHAHVMISAARALGLPARYASGYLLMEANQQDATHAWAEVWVDDLGWVGFDASNSISPDDKYVRIACGLDYLDASPISGIRFGPGDETLEVSVNVQQQ